MEKPKDEGCSLGIWLEAITEQATMPTASPITIKVSALNRNMWPVELRSIKYNGSVKEVNETLLDTPELIKKLSSVFKSRGIELDNPETQA